MDSRNEDRAVYVDRQGVPVYRIHFTEPLDGDIESFLMPRAKDDAMDFIQTVCKNTHCDVRVIVKIPLQDGTDEYRMEAVGYFRHDGDSFIYEGEWVYKMRKWTE